MFSFQTCLAVQMQCQKSDLWTEKSADTAKHIHHDFTGLPSLTAVNVNTARNDPLHVSFSTVLSKLWQIQFKLLSMPFLSILPLFHLAHIYHFFSSCQDTVTVRLLSLCAPTPPLLVPPAFFFAFLNFGSGPCSTLHTFNHWRSVCLNTAKDSADEPFI